MNCFRLAAFALFVFAPAVASADPAPIISPFATARPVVAMHGMVVTQEAAASRVGLDILRRGGNAVDAAVAVGFALAVTLPRAGNIGGGGFMLIHRADLDKDDRDRLSRDGAVRDHQGRVSGRQRRGRSVQVAL